MILGVVFLVSWRPFFSPLYLCCWFFNFASVEWWRCAVTYYYMYDDIMTMLHYSTCFLVTFDRWTSLGGDGLRRYNINLSGHICCCDKSSMLGSNHVQVTLGNFGTFFSSLQFTLYSTNACNGLSRETLLWWRNEKKAKSIKWDLKFMIQFHSSIMQWAHSEWMSRDDWVNKWMLIYLFR